MTQAASPDDLTETPSRPRLAVALIVLIAVAALAAAVTVGYLWGDDGGSQRATPSSSSVDAGFARDMSTHHQQAVTMASYTRDHSDSAQIAVLAYDIETVQIFQVGQMEGWLDTWGLPRSLPRDSGVAPMGWMAEDDHAGMDMSGASTAPVADLMPGMATPAEMARLQSATGKQLDVLFLQLMIRHHQGGLPMAQYAAEHAREPHVRDLAGSMATAQTKEITAMTELLQSLGGTPLPAPSR